MHKNKCCSFFPLSFLSVFALFIFGLSFAQNDTNNWYFGNKAGLNFGNGETTILNDGMMSTPAGCASISDDEEQLLFYTNGQTVWNKNHQVMENGEGLSGEIQGIQSAIIIPKPGDKFTFFIFYTRDVVQTSPSYVVSGIYYSEIKINEQNVLGYVTANKNVRIAETQSTTRLAAIHHPESNSIRVVTITKPIVEFPIVVADDEYVFRVFNVTEDGINAAPIIRQINTGIDKLGAMKISPDGNYLAFADRANQKIYFFTYNNDAVTFAPFFTLPTVPAFGLFIDPYGIEFSQDSKMFYYSGGNNVVQFPFTTIGGANPAESYIIPVLNVGSIQLARDGKIYIAKGSLDSPISSLGVINKPEKSGVDASFQPAGIQFSGNGSTKGLPLFIASSLRSRIIPSDDDCVSNAFTFDLDAYTEIESAFWDFGDGTTSTELNPTHLFGTAGIHKVKATVLINNVLVDLYKKVEAFPLPVLPPSQILSQCDVDNDGISVFNLNNIKDFVTYGSQYQFYHNSTDAVNDENPILNAEFYTNTINPEEVFVKITSEKGCETIASFSLENYQPNTQPIRDLYVCESSDSVLDNFEGTFDLSSFEIEIRTEFELTPNFKVLFFPTLIDAQTKLNAIDTNFTTISTTIWVRIEDENFNCFGVIPFNAIVNSNINLDVEDLYTICDLSTQPPILIDGGIGNSSWIWKNKTGDILSTDRFFKPTQIGTYSVIVEKEENGIICSASKNFMVKEVTIPEFLILNADNGEVFVSVKGNSSYQFSLDGSIYFGSGNSHTFSGVEAGVHTIFVKDIENCEKTISKDIYMLIIPRFFTPNNDSFNDIWKIAGLSSRFYSAAEIQIFDRYGKLLHKMNLAENEVGWSGISNKRALPASDYWYKIALTDLKNNLIIKRGHFSLKR